MKKNVLITGTSTGVGFESSLLFAKSGYKVYASMRNLKKAEALQKRIMEEKLDIEIVQLDVVNSKSIETAVKTIVEKDGKIDILINNAGAGMAKPCEQASAEEIKWITDVNYHGVVFCTKTVLPFMRERRAGKIINVTSVGGLVGQPFNELYCAAKFAVEGFTEALATYVGSAFNIDFTCVEPGGIYTEFSNSAVEATAVNGQLAQGDYAPIFEKYLAGMENRARAAETSPYQTGFDVAEIILDVAKNENPPLRIRTSKWAEEFCKFKTNTDPDGTKLVEWVQKSFL